MQGSLDKSALSQPELLIADDDQRDEILSRFIGLQVRQEFFLDPEEPMVCQGEIADLYYDTKQQAIMIELWWIVVPRLGEDGIIWYDYSKANLPFSNGHNMFIQFPFDRLLSSVEEFSRLGWARITDVFDDRLFFTVYSADHKENVPLEKVFGLNFLSRTM
jgi:hypothetical protein